jgi:hypothetical protein
MNELAVMRKCSHGFSWSGGGGSEVRLILLFSPLRHLSSFLTPHHSSLANTTHPRASPQLARVALYHRAHCQRVGTVSSSFSCSSSFSSSSSHIAASVLARRPRRCFLLLLFVVVVVVLE